MKAIILDHRTSCVKVVTVPDGCVLTEDVEEFLSTKHKMNLSEISYMSVASAEEIPVYTEDSDEPILYL